MLESLAPTIRAAESGRVKRMVCISNNYGVYPGAFYPKQAGADYELPETLEPLARHRKDFTVFSHLDHGIPGGHACVPTLLSGVRPYLASHFSEGNISVDQKAAEYVGPQTRYPSMTLKVNDANLVSFTRTGVQVPALDLREVYRALFLEETSAAKARKSKQIL